MKALAVIVSIMSLAALPPPQRSAENPRDVLDRAIGDFLAGRVKESVTGFDRVSLSAAIYHPGRRTSGELHRTIALLEAARRETLKRRRNSHDGSR